MAEGSQYQQEYVTCNLCGSDNPKLLFAAHKLPDEKMGDTYLTCAKTHTLTGQIVARGSSNMNVVYTSLCAVSA